MHIHCPPRNHAGATVNVTVTVTVSITVTVTVTVSITVTVIVTVTVSFIITVTFTATVSITDRQVDDCLCRLLAPQQAAFTLADKETNSNI